MPTFTDPITEMELGHTKGQGSQKKKFQSVWRNLPCYPYCYGPHYRNGVSTYQGAGVSKEEISICLTETRIEKTNSILFQFFVAFSKLFKSGWMLVNQSFRFKFPTHFCFFLDPITPRGGWIVESMFSIKFGNLERNWFQKSHYDTLLHCCMFWA